ncbi:homeobox and leucine zipper encoding b [Oryzias melastigma]|uniref:homeobox and leucine zipper encoding b n=1 Tax=Oryzias melastigma TaxID=30732 RepID=UPI000CF7DD3F|nr:homeobox and leucine zipper encoding b [Oryzias melastigma]XP_024143418.1 homeobox and leucine zipper encoding b [Oryzias melastigma]
MRHLAIGRTPWTPQKMPAHIAETPTLSGSGGNAPQTHRADINRPLCLPLVSESKKVIWVDSEQVELQLKEQPELENAFDQFPYLTAQQTAALAQRCSLHPDQVKVWFMAKRLEYGISWDSEDIHEVYGKIRAGQGDEGQEKGTDSSEMRSGEEQSVEERGLLGACEAGKLEENKIKIRKKKSVVNRRKKKQTAKKATNPMLKSDTLPDGAIHTRKLKSTRKRPVSEQVKPPNKYRPLPDDPLGDPLPPGITVPANPANRRLGESKQVKMELRDKSKKATDGKRKELIKGSDSPFTDDQTSFPKQQHEDVPHPCNNPSQNFSGKKTCFQLLTLKKAFIDSQYPTRELYCHLSEVTGVSHHNLVKWFKDMRYYSKKVKPGWMTEEQHKRVMGNILYRQCIEKITKMEKQENV